MDQHRPRSGFLDSADLTSNKIAVSVYVRWSYVSKRGGVPIQRLILLSPNALGFLKKSGAFSRFISDCSCIKNRDQRQRIDERRDTARRLGKATRRLQGFGTCRSRAAVRRLGPERYFAGAWYRAIQELNWECWDNAVDESAFSMVKNALFHRRAFTGHLTARPAVTENIEA